MKSNNLTHTVKAWNKGKTRFSDCYAELYYFILIPCFVYIKSSLNSSESDCQRDKEKYTSVFVSAMKHGKVVS